MWIVYILYSQKDKKLYVGCTNNIAKRVQEHNRGLVSSTSNRRPLILIRKEKYQDRKEAYAREKFLKSLWGAREKKQILKKHLDS